MPLTPPPLYFFLLSFNEQSSEIAEKPNLTWLDAAQVPLNYTSFLLCVVEWCELSVIFVKWASLFSCRLCWKKPVAPCTLRRSNRESLTEALFSQSKTNLLVFQSLCITFWAEKKWDIYFNANIVFFFFPESLISFMTVQSRASRQSCTVR